MKKSFYLPYIDGLRAVAIIAVIIYHLNPKLLPGGFTGVDIFLVISGFVVALATANQKYTNFWDFLTTFYVKRFIRILPALLVCLLVVSVMSTLFIPSSWLSQGIESTAKSAFVGLSNFSFMKSNDDYFGPQAEFNPFTHTWFLGIQIQFYLIFPFLFFIWLVINQNPKYQKYQKLSQLTIIVPLLLSLTSYWWLFNGKTELFYFSIVHRFWELAIGILLYQYMRASLNAEESPQRNYRNFLNDKKFIFLASFLSLSFILWSFFLADPTTMPIQFAVLPVLGTVGILYFGSKKNPLFSVCLGNKYMLFIGKISYSLYLWHWPIFVLFKWTIGFETPIHWILALILTVIFSLASYYWVELPFGSLNKNKRNYKPMVLVIGLICLLSSRLYVTQGLFNQKADISLSNFTREDTSFQLASQDSCQVDSSLCEPLNQTSHTIFVVGDSHAIMYQDMFKQVRQDTEFSTKLYTKGGCAYIPLRYDFYHKEGCRSFLDSATKDIEKKAKEGDIVILPGLRIQKFTSQWENESKDELKVSMLGNERAEKIKEAEAQAIPLLKSFTDKKVKVLFFAPSPIFYSPRFRCVDWFNKMNPICSRGLEIEKNFLLSYRLPIMKSMDMLSKKIPNVYIWDAFPILCPDNTCKTTMNGKSTYFDGDHLTSYGTSIVYPDFRDFLQKLYSVK
ncbi:MAG: acyltransferase family protein [Microcystaceae cyanobacterium]